MDIIEKWRLTEKWRYPRFFSSLISGNRAALSEEDLRHAKTVLRMKRGDFAVICNEAGSDYLCAFSGESDFEILETSISEGEPDIFVKLFYCLPKSDKIDLVIQKSVELGVGEIIPIISEHCVVRKVNNEISKLARWNKIAYEAAKQCGRGKVPKVLEISSFEKALSECKNCDLGIIFYECGGERLNAILGEFSASNKSILNIGVFIGSEGGFSKSEIEAAKESGIIPATLGKRVLRTETAPIAALSILMNLTGNM